MLAALSAPSIARDPTDSLSGRSRSKWVGKPITLKTANADLVDVLRLIAEASGFNLVLGDRVQGTIRALDWQDVPWDQALDMIIRTKHLHAERNGNMLTITTNEDFIRGP